MSSTPDQASDVKARGVLLEPLSGPSSAGHNHPKTILERVTALSPLQVTLIVALFYLTLTAAMLERTATLHPELNSFSDRFFTFIMPGTKFDPQGKRPYNLDLWGYDGQFYYDLAVNLWQENPRTVIDKPAYRSSRILYPLLSRVLAFNQFDLIPPAMTLLNLAAILAGTYLLALTLTRLKSHPAWALAYALWPGTVCAYISSLAEPLCYAYIAGALWLHFRHPRAVWRLALLVLAASLTKELALLWGAGWVLYYLGRREWSSCARMVLGWAVPFGLWQGLLVLRFGRDGLSTGEPFSWLPFAGFWRTYAYGSPLIERVAMVLITVGPVIWTLLLLYRAVRSRQPGPGRLDWKTVYASPLFFILAAHLVFAMALPGLSFIYVRDHARNVTGLCLILLLIPLSSFKLVRLHLLGTGLVISLLLIGFFYATGQTFLYSFGL